MGKRHYFSGTKAAINANKHLRAKGIKTSSGRVRRGVRAGDYYIEEKGKKTK